MATEVWSGNQGTLCVYVSKAKDLPNLTKLDKQNVMLRLRIAHMTRESDTLFRAGQNPVFNYLEKYSITPEVKPVMQVEAYCDRRKKPPLLIGRCEVDLLNGIRADPKEGYCSWYELKRERNEFAGTIFIELSFTPSLPHLHKEERSRDMDAMEASIRSRPIPPLPGDSNAPMTSDSFHLNPEPYTHSSAMREITPAAGISKGLLPDVSQSSYSAPIGDGVIPAFNSSVGTRMTLSSEESTTTEVTTTSDTKFHFANLRKLKEKINVFKNPNNSMNHQQSETPVDIEALQKAIGIASLDDDEEYLSRSPSNNVSQVGLEGAERHPSLPPLPSNISRSSINELHHPIRPPLPHQFDSSDMEYANCMHRSGTPNLPPLPKSPLKNKPHSPGRRPPPAV
ncbi:INN1 (YNL152W) [Zygosaccharomyces parabailii]|nr:INN1 (YNL152W) [Zygosaccharomyces parabailii]CDH17411.1 related to Ingression protein 1 [Zygosaccharomyces bailii ISA1307]